MATDADPHSEKRRHPRKDITRLVAVSNLLTGQSLGQLVNLSADGFMLMGNGEVKEDCLYQLIFELDGRRMSLGAECLWRRDMDSGSQYWAGFHIIDISEQDSEVIASLLAE